MLSILRDKNGKIVQLPCILRGGTQTDLVPVGFEAGRHAHMCPRDLSQGWDNRAEAAE